MLGGNVVGIWHSNACHLAFDYWYLVFGIWQIWQIWQIDSVLWTEYFENIFDEQIFFRNIFGNNIGTNIVNIWQNVLGRFWWAFCEHFWKQFCEHSCEHSWKQFCEHFWKQFCEHSCEHSWKQFDEQYFVNTLETISSEVGWSPSNRTEVQQIGP